MINFVSKCTVCSINNALKEKMTAKLYVSDRTAFFVMLVIFSVYSIGYQHLKLFTYTFHLQYRCKPFMIILFH